MQSTSALSQKLPYTLNGNYILTETVAPDGYIKSIDKYYINIDSATKTIKLYKVTDSQGNIKSVQFVDKDGTTKTVSESTPMTLYSETTDANGVVTANPIPLSIKNIQQEYPMTGGFGSVPFWLVGSIVIFASLIYLNKKNIKLSLRNS